jgi:hypothetical protein
MPPLPVRLHGLAGLTSSQVVCGCVTGGGSGLPPSNNVDYVGEYAEPHAQTPKGSLCHSVRETDHERGYHCLRRIGYS